MAEPDPQWLRRLERGALAALVFASVAIAWQAARPPMHDASSHIATSVIAHRLLEGDAFTSAHYSFDAVPVPYWTTTALMVPLLEVFDPITAFRLLVVAYVIALPLAFRWLLRIANPDGTAWALLGVAVAFNWAYWLGEINFFIGQPLVLVGFALFLQLEHVKSLRFVGFAVVAVALYFSHVFALVALLAAIGSLVLRELVAWRRPAWADRRLRKAHWVAVGWTGVLFIAAAYFVMFHHGTEANTGHVVFDLGPYRLAAFATNPLQLVEATHSRLPVLMVAAVAAVALVPLAFARSAAPRRQLAHWARADLLWPAVTLAALTYLGPAGIEDEFSFEDIGQRFTLCALLFAFGAVRMAASPRARAALIVALIAVTGVELRDAARMHRTHDAEAAHVSREVIEHIPVRSRVLPLFDVRDPSKLDMLLHRYANYVVVDRDGYNPHIFARTGQQPLRHIPWGDYRVMERLDVTDAEWAFYDYVVVQTDRDQPAVPGLADHATEIAHAGKFRLYRITHPPR